MSGGNPERPIRCRVGWHRWHRVWFVHDPCVQDNREYGWTWLRCARCGTWQSPKAPLAPRSSGCCDCAPRVMNGRGFLREVVRRLSV